MISAVQTQGNTQGNSATAMTIAMATNLTAGNLVVVAVETYQGSGTITVSVSDSLGNSYVQAGTYSTISSGGNYSVSIWYAKNVTGGACTITVTQNASCYMTASGTEYSGADTTSPLDGTSTNSASSGATFSAGTTTVGSAQELVYLAVGYFVNIVVATKSNIGIRYAQFASAATPVLIAGDGIFSASVNPMILSSGSGSPWVAAAASFKAAAGGGGSSVIIIEDD